MWFSLEVLETTLAGQDMIVMIVDSWFCVRKSATGNEGSVRVFGFYGFYLHQQTSVGTVLNSKACSCIDTSPFLRFIVHDKRELIPFHFDFRQQPKRCICVCAPKLIRLWSSVSVVK